MYSNYYFCLCRQHKDFNGPVFFVAEKAYWNTYYNLGATSCVMPAEFKYVRDYVYEYDGNPYDARLELLDLGFEENDELKTAVFELKGWP